MTIAAFIILVQSYLDVEFGLKEGLDMAYEQGMSIQHDAINHVVTIHFRGKRYEIEVPGVDRATATAKGEEYCRKLGWVG